LVDAAYPEGSYRLQISTAHEGTVTPALQISGSAYPNAPHLRNFAALQMADASNPLALSWDGFVGGNSNDFVFVEIADSVGGWFVTKSYGKSGALNGTATTVTVPDGTLLANHLYKGRLLFEKILAVNETAYPGAEGLAGYFARTQFTVATAGPDNPPRLSSWQLTSGGQMKFTLRALAGGDYRIDSSTNLIQWLPLRTISATQNETEFFDSTQAHPSCFYRAVFVP
jgi:hypothetical protein